MDLSDSIVEILSLNSARTKETTSEVNLFSTNNFFYYSGGWISEQVFLHLGFSAD